MITRIDPNSTLIKKTQINKTFYFLPCRSNTSDWRVV